VSGQHEQNLRSSPTLAFQQFLHRGCQREQFTMKTAQITDTLLHVSGTVCQILSLPHLL